MLNHRPLLLAGAPVWNEPYEVRAPWDGRIVTLVSQAGTAEAEAAALAAAQSFQEMRHMPAHRRASILRGAADGLRRRQEEIIEVLRDEGGKPVRLGREEVERSIQTLSQCADEAGRVDAGVLSLCPDRRAPALVKRSFPRGPVLALTPYNFPLHAVCQRVGPAVAAGCPIVVRPAEQTPSAALILGEILVLAGLPDRAISVLPCDRTVMDALSTNPHFATLFYTGCDRAGWNGRATAGRRHVLLDHGLDNNAIVEPDADLDHAVTQVSHGAYAHAGQGCASMQRILVHSSVYARVRDRLVSALETIPHGDPSEDDVVCGPLIDTRRRAQVEAWMEDAELLGARRLGGGRRAGTVLTPALFEAPGPGWKAWGHRASGPVAVVESYASLDEAVDRINAAPYPQETGLFTRDMARLWRVFDRLDAGSLVHNEYPARRPARGGEDDPQRGGRNRQRLIMEEMTEVRTLVLHAN